MKKNIKNTEAIFPMPVLMIAIYDENGVVDVMNAAWGSMCGRNKVMLKLSANHKTVKNFKNKGFFTVSIADSSHVLEADYFGVVSENNDDSKFEKSKLTAVKSELIDAPIIEEFPVVAECKFLEYQDGENGAGVIGEVLNVQVDEKALDEEGNLDISKLDALVYDPFNREYYKVGEKVEKAFSVGFTLK